MLNKMLMNVRHGLGFSMLSSMVAFEDEGLGIIELESNLADVEKPLPLPAGLYTGEIQDVQVQTSQKGNQYFAIKFVIPQDEISADLADQFEDGAAMYYNRVVVPNGKDRRALFNLRKFIEAIGLDSNTTQIDPNQWMGARARLKVVTSKWEGEDRAEIKSIESAERKPAAAAAAGGARGRGRK